MTNRLIMHIYIYDSYLSDKKYDKILANIETRITDLGLNGKIIRLSVMKNANSAISDEIKRGAKTIIAVGNDKTINEITNVLANIGVDNYTGANIVFGIIPIGEKYNYISSVFGIQDYENACEILSARRIEKINIAQAGNKYFLSNALISGQGTILEISKNYSIEIIGNGEVNIINLPILENVPKNMKSNPSDGVLELCIEARSKKTFFGKSKKLSSSFLSLKKISIMGDKKLLLDNSIEVNLPVEVSVLKRKLNVIVGKERKF